MAIQDLTTGQYLFYDNFEGTTPVSTSVAPDTSGSYLPNHAVLGSWISNDANITASSQVTNSKAAPDPGPFQGNNYLREYRSGAYEGGTVIGRNATTVATVGDVIKFRTMVYVSSAEDTFARAEMILLGTTTGSGLDFQTTPAFIIGDGAGNVIAETGNGSGTGGFTAVPTGLHYATNAWQEWDITYTIGSPTYSVTVNGITASGFGAYYSGGGIAGIQLGNGNDSPGGSVYYDSVPGISILPGDLNQDGQVNLTDYSILTSHWLQTGVSASNGDLNGDGTVNISDFAIFKQDYIAANGGGGSGLAAAVPEPAAFVLIAFALPALYFVRRFKSGTQK